MLFDNMNSDYVSRLGKGAGRVASTSALGLLMDNVYGTGREAASRLDQQGISGVILTAPLSDDRHLMLQIEKRGLPFARIASMLDPGRGITISMDEYEAALQVTMVLLEAGHRKIGIIRGPRSHLASMRRYNGFTAAMGTKGARLDPRLVVEGDFTRQSGETEGAKLLAGSPTAIFASNDAMAQGMNEAARKAGLSLPQDLSIVGFDDDPIAARMNPPLTSIRQPLEEMGAKAFELLAANITGRGAARAHADVPFEVVRRASVVATSGSS